MIQISNPILAPEIPIETHLLDDRVTEEIHGAQENKKPGLFARLLESLKAKSEVDAEKNAANSAGEDPNVVKASYLGEKEAANSQNQSLFVEAAGKDIPDVFAFVNLDIQAEQNLNLQSSLMDDLLIDKYQNDKHLIDKNLIDKHQRDHGIAEKDWFLANFKDTNREELNHARLKQVDHPSSDHLKTESRENSGHALDTQTKDQFQVAWHTSRSTNAGDEKGTLNVHLKGLENQYSENTKADDSIARLFDKTETTPKETDLRLSENRDRRGRFNVQVQDFRTEQIQAAVKETGSGETIKVANNETEIPVYLKNVNGEAAGAKQTASQNSIYNARFEDALAQELRGNLSTDIVRDATFIIRNGGEGTIRLSLHPASLGNVKIRLEMSENKITGQIIVQSSEAYRAFEREISVLEKAFRDAGYSETSLEMSLDQDQWNFGADQEAALAEEQRRENENLPLYQLTGSSGYESESSVSISAISERKAVNLLI